MKSEEEIRERLERHYKEKDQHKITSVEWVQASLKAHLLEWVLDDEPITDLE